MTDRFYADLPTFSDFAGVAEVDAYRPIPDDWVILATDIQGSTRAIEEGRYNDVNMLGAASITAVLNVCDGIQVPYVFGGDGGTLIVPSSIAPEATQALLGLQAISEKTFGLALRVGAIPVADIRAGGEDLLIRKYQLSPGNNLAMFAGGGMELADALLKDPANRDRYLPQPSADLSKPDLSGLSCRWNPLIPRGGKVAAIMVRGIAADPRVRRAVIGNAIEGIALALGGTLESAAPVDPQIMRYRWPPSKLALEARATAGKEGFYLRFALLIFWTFLQLWSERFNFRLGFYNPPQYHEEMRANNDFRKFDGILRLVLDVSQGQADAIEAYLESEYRARRLIYGMHIADTALMTCLVFDLRKSEHVHFIDAGDGGYAKAAGGYKRRIKELGGMPGAKS